MKYFIHYPISRKCTLRCSYCFHAGEWDTEYPKILTIEAYKKWCDTYLQNAEEIIVNFHGADCFSNENAIFIANWLDQVKGQRVELLTNGLQDRADYLRLLPHKNRINLIGCTFHRTVIGNRADLVNQFRSNVLWLKDLGFPVYVKELLLRGFRDPILSGIAFWRQMGIESLVSDFRGSKKNAIAGEKPVGDEWAKYDVYDEALISAEYKRPTPCKSCKMGYKNIIIRGSWHEGEVLECWEKPKSVIGNIMENTYLVQNSPSLRPIGGGNRG